MARLTVHNCEKLGCEPNNFSNKVYQVDSSRNESDETNTIRLFSDRLDLSTRSYAGGHAKNTLFGRFWNFTGATHLKCIFVVGWCYPRVLPAQIKVLPTCRPYQEIYTTLHVGKLRSSIAWQTFLMIPTRAPVLNQLESQFSIRI